MTRRAGLHGGGSGRPRDWVAQRPRPEAVPFFREIAGSEPGTHETVALGLTPIRKRAPQTSR